MDRPTIIQEKLAEIIGIDYKYIQRIEGKTPPAVKIDTIKRLASALKVKPATLLERQSSTFYQKILTSSRQMIYYMRWPKWANRVSGE